MGSTIIIKIFLKSLPGLHIHQFWQGRTDPYCTGQRRCVRREDNLHELPEHQYYVRLKNTEKIETHRAAPDLRRLSLLSSIRTSEN